MVRGRTLYLELTDTSMTSDLLIEPHCIPGDACVLDCRFSLADPDQGRQAYLAGHIPGALYIDLNQDLCGPTGQHGGRHPLPPPAVFAATLAGLGIGRETPVVAYDDTRFAFASRLWWMMRSLGYRPPQLLNGGFQAWLAAGGEAEPGPVRPLAVAIPELGDYRGICDINSLRDLQAAGAWLVDSREPRRYQGLEEPIDPVAGHIPGAINRPWQNVTDTDARLADTATLHQHWEGALAAEQLVVYCGSGVTACVNLFSLAALGRDDAILYPGSWSDWCSYL